MTKRRRTRAGCGRVEGLENRLLMAAPVIDPIADVSVPAKKTLIVPVTGSDADGNPVTYSVQGGSAVSATLLTGNTDIDFKVAGYGDLLVRLLPQFAPNTVATYENLINGPISQGPFAGKSHFFDGLTFHRVVPNFVIQGGDPNGNGSGGPGFSYDDEFNAQAIFSGNGQLANANSGPDTNGSQFFLTVGPQRFLDFGYTLWGQLLSGFDVLAAIDSAPGTSASVSTPSPPVVITSARIVQDTTDAVLLLQSTGASGSSAVTVTANDGHGGVTSRTFNAATVADTMNDPPDPRPGREPDRRGRGPRDGHADVDGPGERPGHLCGPAHGPDPPRRPPASPAAP